MIARLEETSQGLCDGQRGLIELEPELAVDLSRFCGIGDGHGVNVGYLYEGHHV